MATTKKVKVKARGVVTKNNIESAYCESCYSEFEYDTDDYDSDPADGSLRACCTECKKKTCPACKTVCGKCQSRICATCFEEFKDIEFPCVTHRHCTDCKRRYPGYCNVPPNDNYQCLTPPAASLVWRSKRDMQEYIEWRKDYKQRIGEWWDCWIRGLFLCHQRVFTFYQGCLPF